MKQSGKNAPALLVDGYVARLPRRWVFDLNRDPAHSDHAGKPSSVEHPYRDSLIKDEHLPHTTADKALKID